jgi:glyoxylase-like metal-dependent hydrolase (beta-lactamase superfamily II)
MFGVVPKPLWERRIPADERNRIPLAMRCLLVETPGALVLIETGLGNKEDSKFQGIYGVENGGSPDQLQDQVRAAGFAPGDIQVVIDTHLHFDHAGGNTYRDAEGQVRVSFPSARYYVQRREWEWAHTANERTQASYLPHNFEPVMADGRLEFLEGAAEVIPGIRVVPTPGHCPGHQSVLVQSGGETACFLGDLIPTFAHLPLPWIMGYDVEPLVTLEAKRKLLRQAVDERWLLVSVHDPEVAWGEATGSESKVVLENAAPAAVYGAASTPSAMQR